MKVVFRIRKRYFDDIVSGEKTVEYRKRSMFWLRRLARKPEVAVFICGKRVHRRKIKLIEMAIPTPQNFSEQGKKDVPTLLCNAIHLGEEIKEK